jgi:hypothetical protein
MEQTDRPGFWKRQFGGEPTRAQTVADLFLGLFLPLLCLVFDPVVFRGFDRILSHYRWIAYAFMGAELCTLALWLLLRRRLGGSAVFFAGPLLAGGVFALILGLGMLPLTLFGLFMVIGFLGFSPFFTATVFFRNGVRALRRSGNRLGWFSRGVLLAAGVLFIGTPSMAVLHFRHHETLPQLLEALSGKMPYPEVDPDLLRD